MQRVVPTDSILIPPDAHRVYKGVIFDVYQWEQELFDGTTKTFEMLRRPDSIAVMVLRDNQILYLEDEQPHRGVMTVLPGGRSNEDDDEDWLQAGQRELREETGIVCAKWKLLHAQQPQRKIEWFGVTYVATDITSEHAQQLDAGGEKISVHWQDYLQLREKVLADEIPSLSYMRHIFEKYASARELVQAPEFSGKMIDQ